VNLSDFDYPLPKELIAQRPLEKRDASRLLVCDRKRGTLGDKHFSDILDYLPAGDVLVLNNTKVFSARLLGKKKKTEGRVEILLLQPARDQVFPAPEGHDPRVWRCLLQPALKEAQEIIFQGEKIEAVFIRRDSDGIPLIEFKGSENVKGFVERVGTMPLPPYIKRDPDLSDETTYQTVYAEKEGAVAAPTAGFHFTKELLEAVKKKGLEVLFVTLHVGYGTFRPVEDLENHKMHSESFELEAPVAEKINRAKAEGRNVWAVGTTALRVLETCVQKRKLIPGKGETNLFIKPPFEFEIVDRLVTNFHLPKTTLLLLVSAFMGEEFRKKAYEHAIINKYRFYSYGDAMVIL